MAIIVFVTVFLFYRQLFTTSFQDMIAGTLGINSRLVHYLLMLLLSLAVVASLRSVGVILVVSMLITPASAALLLANRLPVVLLWSAVLGIVSAFFGLIFSISLDIPVGPSMAVTTTLIYFLVGLFAPNKGFISRWLTRKKIQAKVIIEDIVKRSMKSHQHEVIDMESLAIQTGQPLYIISKYMDQLIKLGLFSKENNHYLLTDLGIQRGSQLIRAHRLWETFMVEELGLNADQIHDEAEIAEHLLSAEDINIVDERLGYPEVDPHGSPIPR
jgi:Mn-dependent DtxR family transcriptional regulator